MTLYGKYQPQQVEDVVRAQIEVAGAFLRSRPARRASTFRREVACAILGSRMHFSTVLKAVANLEAAGLLDDEWWVSTRRRNFRTRVETALRGRARQRVHNVGVRFGATRARQIAEARSVIRGKSILEFIRHGHDPLELRRQLVREVPGLGPKQASLVLRNLGVTADLAIIDAHVARYLAATREIDVSTVARLQGYESVEGEIRLIAHAWDVSVGTLDLAIWSTMVALREIAA